MVQLTVMPIASKETQTPPSLSWTWSLPPTATGLTICRFIFQLHCHPLIAMTYTTPPTTHPPRLPTSSTYHSQLSRRPTIHYSTSMIPMMIPLGSMHPRKNENQHHQHLL